MGLIRFWNSEWAGFSLSAPDGRGTTLEEGEFSTAYFTFTVSADPGLLLNLDNLTFGSARGGGNPDTQTRRFELFASIDGAPFDYAGGPLLFVDNETGTRTSPVSRSADLSGATYQNVQSVSFRYYPLTPAQGNTMDFNGMTLNGSVIPEPSTVPVLVALSLAGILQRRR